MSLKKRDIKLYVVCHTAKAYFPDRQSCSTLCRQPFGCARSVEVVAVYPSLGSYSVVVFSVGITSFQAAFDFAIHYVWSGKACFLRLHSTFCRLVQNWLLVFVHYNKLVINPSTYTHWERAKKNPNWTTFLFLYLCTNSAHCFCAILRLEKALHLYGQNEVFRGGCLSKVL